MVLDVWATQTLCFEFRLGGLSHPNLVRMDRWVPLPTEPCRQARRVGARGVRGLKNQGLSARSVK